MLCQWWPIYFWVSTYPGIRTYGSLWHRISTFSPKSAFGKVNWQWLQVKKEHRCFVHSDLRPTQWPRNLFMQNLTTFHLKHSTSFRVLLSSRQIYRTLLVKDAMLRKEKKDKTKKNMSREFSRFPWHYITKKLDNRWPGIAVSHSRF